MKYNLANEQDVKEAREYLTKLLSKKAIVEITQKHLSRTLNQNNYLYLLLGYCALEAGMDREEFKTSIFKIIINRDLFITKEVNKFGLEYTKIKSTADLTIDEMAIAIDKLKRFVAENMDLYLPDVSEIHKLNHISNEIEKNRKWL